MYVSFVTFKNLGSVILFFKFLVLYYCVHVCFFFITSQIMENVFFFLVKKRAHIYPPNALEIYGLHMHAASTELSIWARAVCVWLDTVSSGLIWRASAWHRWVVHFVLCLFWGLECALASGLSIPSATTVASTSAPPCMASAALHCTVIPTCHPLPAAPRWIGGWCWRERQQAKYVSDGWLLHLLTYSSCIYLSRIDGQKGTQPINAC